MLDYAQHDSVSYLTVGHGVDGDLVQDGGGAPSSAESPPA